MRAIAHKVFVDKEFAAIIAPTIGTRRQPHVERWVAAKIVLYHLHLAQQTVEIQAA